MTKKRGVPDDIRNCKRERNRNRPTPGATRWPTTKQQPATAEYIETEDLEPAESEPPAAEVSPGGAVIFHPVRCPECDSDDTKVTSTRRPVRYHKCRACKATFKSVEK